jgi:hypothetical protein
VCALKFDAAIVCATKKMWSMLLLLVSLAALAIAGYVLTRVWKIEKQSLVSVGLAGDKLDQMSQMRAAINSVDARLNTFMDLLMNTGGPEPPAVNLHCDGNVCTMAPPPAPPAAQPDAPKMPEVSFASMADQVLGFLVNNMAVPDAVVSSARVEEMEADEPAEADTKDATEDTDTDTPE